MVWQIRYWFIRACPSDKPLYDHNEPLLLVNVYLQKVVNSKRKKEPKKEK